MTLLINKTYEPTDLDERIVKDQVRALSHYALKMFLRGAPFAVNGVLRRRFYVRTFKMWEYARGLAFSQIRPPMRVLDFGGGATLPVFFLAERGCEVVSVDINQRFTDYANAFAARHALRLTASSRDLVSSPVPEDWGMFDRIISFCVIEHLPQDAQVPTMKKLAGLLRPGGIMAVTFDFGPQAPSEWPLRSRQDVDRLVRESGLRLIGNTDFRSVDRFYVIDKKYPHAKFTLGSLFLTTPTPG
ncbi:MAG TPA: class I SAM-dependent methyltransferase [Nitrospiria bacterium]|nr:class I SAM-dependent methyltransferase [Nitrospiria bacterium]